MPVPLPCFCPSLPRRGLEPRSRSVFLGLWVTWEILLLIFGWEADIMTVPASLAVVGGYGSLRFALDGLGAGGFSIASIKAMNQFAI